MRQKEQMGKPSSPGALYEDASILGLKGHPSKLFVEVTTRCNLKCRMCVKQDGNCGIKDGDMSWATFNRLKPAFPFLEVLILNGIGEPLLHPYLEEFISIAKKSMPGGSWVGFQTNGMLLEDRRAETLIDSGLDRICLSADARTQELFCRVREGGKVTDVERAFSALNGAKAKCGRHDVQIGIEFVLMRSNLYEFPETLRWAARQGVTFAIVTQLLPYTRDALDHAVYDTNTAGAVAIYEKWKKKAKDEGVDFMRYYDISVFMKYFKDREERIIFDFVEGMKAEAFASGITLNMERLFKKDDKRFGEVERVFEEAEQIAKEAGIDIKLPEIAPRNKRKCEFVEGGSAFVSWSGDIHPCYFLWHRYDCYVGGLEKQVNPWVIESLSGKDIMEIWNEGAFRSFREEVLRYDFPFCFDCGFALCDYVQTKDYEQDCYVSGVPCGACLWCTGLFLCLH